MRNFLFLFAFWLCFACSDQLQTNGTKSADLVQKSENELNPDLKEDYQAPFFLDTAYIVGTALWVEVSYSGGCREHDFMMVWPEVITMVYPPDFGVTLYHNAKGDHCEAMISDTLKIDLQETPTGSFNPETISQMRLTVVNGSNPEEKESNR